MNDHRQGSRFEGLDGLRAIAVLAVVWHHAHPGSSWLPISANGFLGVDVFFVLSGFLITHLLIEERRATGSVSLQNFYMRRSLRIFPVYFAVLGALAAVYAYRAGPQATAYFAELPWHASFLSNWVETKSLMFVSWSLSTEEQFYLIWPVAFVLLGAWASWLLAALFVICELVSFGVFDAAMERIGLPYRSLNILQVTFAPILIGAALALITHRHDLFKRLSGLPDAWILALCAVALCLANVAGDLRGTPRLGFHLAVALLLASIVANPQSIVTRALEWRPLAFVGTVSYGVYLLHMLTIDLTTRALGSVAVSSPVLVFVLSAALAVVVAAASFRWFERPLIDFGKRYRWKPGVSAHRGGTAKFRTTGRGAA